MSLSTLIRPPGSSAAALLLTASILFHLIRRRTSLSNRKRQRIIAPASERVIIFGASSGTGASIAHQYAQRGCKALVLVARRKEQLHAVRDDCLARVPTGKPAPSILCISADCTKDTDIVSLRKQVLDQVGGIDTMHITLGVSALLPLLGIAGVDPLRPNISAQGPSSSSSSQQQQSQPTHASSFALSSTYNAVSRACTSNLTSTALLLTAFTPLLQLSSEAPSIHILSSLAAMFPAPTRALYGATKAAQLILAQGFELETDSQVGLEGELHPTDTAAAAAAQRTKRAKITFVYLCPGTILSDFRRSAVDLPSTEDDEALARAGIFDSTWNTGGGGGGGGGKNMAKSQKSDGLRPEDVASRAIALVDAQRGGIDTMKPFYFFARLALVLAPWIPARVAHKKYGY
ncbi:hypothetical protein OC846_003316 [Tilletia horrida]|uniref:NAD(P)-binding protein n=1 Tax=Tilletia horrida TaxID=155126 RepID=A0AAN6GPX5_9BASI|nr:hypothetical protein OC846_003316 [Tilletia horrida]KAK0568617.1 hypothetical protein OC861_001779 [Tilletia horrida]